MQKVITIGRLGKDAQVRTSQNGKQYLSFTVAVNSKRNGNEQTTWYDVSSFNTGHIENLTKWLLKGKLVSVTGELDAHLSESNGKNYLNLRILADSIEFVSVGRENEQKTSNADSEITMGTKNVTTKTVQQQAQPVMSTSTSSAYGSVDDELPF